MRSASSFQKWSQTKDFENWIFDLKVATGALPDYGERRAMENFMKWALETTKESRKEQRLC